MNDTAFLPGTMALLALSFLTPYFYYIPRATLSAVLICAVMFMVDFKIIKLLWKGCSQYFIYIYIITAFRVTLSAIYNIFFSII